MSWWRSIILSWWRIWSGCTSDGRSRKADQSHVRTDVKVVFIGPCIAKKRREGDDRTTGFVDAVLNFEEVESWLQERDISIRM